MAESATLVGNREPVILTIDNGGTNTRIAESAEIITSIDSYPTPRKYDEAIAQIAFRSRLALGGRRPDGVGFSIAGAVQDGRIVQAGQLDEYGWVGLPFAQDVATELGISAERVVLLNDCAAGATAERKARNLKVGKNGAFMVLSTGFGGSIYNDEQIIADEPGHYFLRPGAICGEGQDGHIEAHVSGSGIARKFGVSGENISHSDPRWQEIKSDFHDSMAQTLGRYEEELGISLDVIGFTGSVALGGPNMLGDLQADLRTRMGKMAPRIEEAVYRDESGLYGAAFAADALLKV